MGNMLRYFGIFFPNVDSCALFNSKDDHMRDSHVTYQLSLLMIMSLVELSFIPFKQAGLMFRYEKVISTFFIRCRRQRYT